MVAAGLMRAFNKGASAACEAAERKGKANDY
jgi:hypothetical protein